MGGGAGASVVFLVALLVAVSCGPAAAPTAPESSAVPASAAPQAVSPSRPSGPPTANLPLSSQPGPAGAFTSTPGASVGAVQPSAATVTTAPLRSSTATATAAPLQQTAAPAPATVAPPTPTPPPAPPDLLISVESPNCSTGGPIYKWVAGKLSVLASGAPLNKPRDGAFDGRGNLIIADGIAGLLRVNLSTGAVTIIAASGPPYQPRDVFVEESGNYVVIDWPDGIHPEVGPALYRITPAGQVSVIARGAPMVGPHGLDRDGQGNWIVSDVKGGEVIRITPQGQQTVVLTRPTGGFGMGSDVVVDRDGTYVVGDATGALLRVTPSGQVTTIHRGAPFSALDTASQIGGPRSVKLASNGDYLVLDARSATVFRVTRSGSISTVLKDATLCEPAGVLLLSG